MKPLRLKFILIAFSAALLLTALHAFHIANFERPFFSSFDFIFYDFKQNLFLQKKSQEPKVTVIEIDEPSLIELGRWPWPRKQMADLIERILQKGADRVLLDLVFSETSDEKNDAALVNLAKKYKDRIVWGAYVNSHKDISSKAETKCLQDFIFTKKNSATTEKWSGNKNYQTPYAADFDALFEENLKSYLSEKKKESMFDLNDSQIFHLNIEHAHLVEMYCDQVGEKDRSHFFKRDTPTNIILNFDELQAEAGMTGAFSVVYDRDGAIRRYYTRYDLADLFVPTLAGVGNLDEPHPNPFWINYTEKTPGRISAARFLENEKTDLKGQTVLVGITAPGVYDIRKAPISEALPGTFILAQAESNLKNRNYLKYWPYAPYLLFALVFVLLYLLQSYQELRWAFSSGIFIVIAGAMVLFELGLFQFHFFFWSFDFYLVWMLIFFANNYLFYKKESSQKDFVRSIFSKYVSENVVDDLMKSPEKINLSGEKKQLSVFFSDIRNFTSLSEKMDPVIISQFLNTYFDPMVETIKRNGGTVDKFIGDGLMAFFGAPVENPDNARLACRSALLCIENLRAINVKVSKSINSEVSIGIGLNLQEVFVGNIGSSNLQSYTVIGDGVNLAARLQALTKKYGVKIIVSDSIYQKCAREFAFRKLDLVKVKGRTEPIWIYELQLVLQAAEKETYIKGYEDMLESFIARDLKSARLKMDQLLKVYPDDTALNLINGRLTGAENSPESEWESFKFGSS